MLFTKGPWTGCGERVAPIGRLHSPVTGAGLGGIPSLQIGPRLVISISRAPGLVRGVGTFSRLGCDDMASGTVKWFNTAKGFGFIQPDDGGSDVFVHILSLNQAGMDSLNEGDKVDYELEQDRRSGKLAATGIVVTAAGEPAP